MSDPITATWSKVDPERRGIALECGAFYLNHDLSEFDRADVHFKQKAKAWLVVCTKPVLNKHMQEIGAKDMSHGWDYPWYVRFIPTGWNDQQFRGEAKSIEQAKRMAFNMATALYAAVADISEPSLNAGEVEALKGEVKALRHNLRMIRYGLRDEPKALSTIKHYLVVDPVAP